MKFSKTYYLILYVGTLTHEGKILMWSWHEFHAEFVCQKWWKYRSV